MVENFEISRSIEIGVHKLPEVFKGLENVEELRKVFGEEELKKVLQDLCVRITKRHGYMWVDEENCHICISFDYLSRADEKYIYLDMVHELIHIKQLKDGRELFDKNYIYVERPTEIEAYKITVSEAKRIGMTDNEIIYYLSVEWINQEDRVKLLKTLGLI